ncbi:Ig-like domain-containing protein [candidate division KSB1 bacterium]|nr:Ig-like domain-containing protein [candidate division KSB1 bacterium]
MITWKQDGKVFFQRFDPEANPLGENVPLEKSVTGSSLSAPRIDFDSVGHFWIVWDDERDGNYNIYCQRIDHDGAINESDFRVNTDETDAIQGRPAISVHAKGSCIIVWEDQREGNRDIYGQVLNNSAEVPGANFRINDDSGNSGQYTPALDQDIEGNFVVIWRDDRNTNADIYRQSYTNQVKKIGPNIRVNSDEQTSTQVKPDVRLMNQVIYSVWEDGRIRGKKRDVFARLDSFFPQPPAPIVTSPKNNTFINKKRPVLTFYQPADYTGTAFHFKLEIAFDSLFSKPVAGSPFLSQTNSAGFLPKPPLAGDSCHYTLQSDLNDENYYWRVYAIGDYLTSESSRIFNFKVDTQSPTTTGHNPAPNATDVPINTNITVKVQDQFSGVKTSSLVMKINNQPVQFVLSGTAYDYTLFYNPPVDFNYEQTVSVQIEASDIVGNQMRADVYSFKTIKKPNVPPGAPTLIAPVHKSFLKTNLPQLQWSVPSDENGDPLHFRIELDEDHNWQTISRVIESKTSTAGFSPVPPIAPGVKSASYLMQNQLTEGSWWWRVAAWDGEVQGNYSNEFEMIIDLTAPKLSDQIPEKNATEVDIQPTIQFRLQDAVSKIRRSTIILKVNNLPVTPNITGDSSNYLISYRPLVPYGYNKKITVTIDAQDWSGNQLPTENYSFYTKSDLVPPFTAQHEPIKYAQNVSIYTNITFHIKDIISGVDSSSIKMQVNDSTVTYQISGIPTDYTIIYTPTKFFNYQQTVSITIDAQDLAGNKMNTDNYIFITTNRPNSLPEAPVLTSPADSLLTKENTPKLSWLVPQDPDNNQLHFKVELDEDHNWNSISRIIESKVNPDRFSPSPPVNPGVGSVNCDISPALSEGRWWWRVAAWDGQIYGPYSSERSLVIDVTAPVASGHIPAKNATNVKIGTNISLKLKDNISGVKTESITLLVNGKKVTPTIQKTTSETVLTYQPETKFRYEEVVTISLDATDMLNNRMQTESYTFTTEKNPNLAPGMPLTRKPANSIFTNLPSPVLEWTVPEDKNQDTLHFRLEMDDDQNWDEATYRIESQNDATGFLPRPPVTQNDTLIKYQTQIILNEGEWRWRVSAWDGQVYGDYSKTAKFFIDLTPPNTANHNPSKNASGVAIDGIISVHIQDALSGVQKSSIIMKVNNQIVTPTIDGSVNSYIVNYKPSKNFGYLQKITVSLEAKDSAGNLLLPENYSFTTAGDDNTAPQAPELASPIDNKIFNTRLPVFSWNVPPDTNQDSLHFKFELTKEYNWAQPTYIFESKKNSTGFQPVPPLPSGNGTASYTPGSNLAEGNWWWRVAAWDGKVFSSYSKERHLLIDITKPMTTDHRPARNATQIPTTTDISVQLKDSLSGIDSASIVLKVNSKVVKFDISGTSTNYKISYKPSTAFGYEQKVNVSIEAKDRAGNKMDTDAYSFTTSKNANVAPAVPTLASPTNNGFLNNVLPQLTWQVPDDANGDSLHFRVEIATNEQFTTHIYGSPFESRSIKTGFTPSPPVKAGDGNSQFTLSTNLVEGSYWWRVAAWDKKVYGDYSTARKFTIDITKPSTRNHAPAKNATNVSVSTNISLQIRDNSSGVAKSSIVFQVNGKAVTPQITGTEKEYTITYDPAQDLNYNEKITIKIEAADIAGNKLNPETYSFTTEKFYELPVFIHNPTTIAVQGKEISLETIVREVNNYPKVYLYYRPGGVSQYDSLEMQSDGESQYNGTIPGTIVTERGVEYFMSARSTQGMEKTDPLLKARVNPHVVRVYVNNLIRTEMTPPGSYRLISIPLSLESSRISQVLADDLGAYERTIWRLMRLQNGNYQEYTVGDIEDFAPGKSYWLITKNAAQIDAGPGYSTATDTNFVIQLQPGWNMIGNPFAFPVKWDTIIHQGDVEAPVSYTGQGNDAQGFVYNQKIMSPWEGYLVKNLTNQTVSIEIPPIAEEVKTIQKANEFATSPRSSEEWYIQFVVECKNSIDRDNYLGCRLDASSEWDANDFSEVPPFADFIHLYFPHHDWPKYPGIYAGDFRAPVKKGIKAEVMVATNIQQAVAKLSLAKSENLPSSWEILLIDRNTGVSSNLKKDQSYSFSAESRVFDLIIGEKEFLEQNESSNLPMISSFQITQNYPNPFNPETNIDYWLPVDSPVNIKIYNLLGQEIKTLVSTCQPKGHYHLKWDGTMDSGKKVPGGIYLYQFQAGEFSTIRKMLLIE